MSRMVFFSDLEAAHRAAIERVKAANHLREDALVLDGVTFLPDGVDQQDGPLLKVLGAVALIAGAVFTFIAVDGSQAEPWMKFVGPPVLAIGGAIFFYGKKVKREAAGRARSTGLYLLDDAMIQVTGDRTFVFPRACVRGFEYREHASSDGPRYTLLVHYEDEDGASEEHVLNHDDITGTLNAWRG